MQTHEAFPVAADDAPVPIEAHAPSPMLRLLALRGRLPQDAETLAAFDSLPGALHDWRDEQARMLVASADSTIRRDEAFEQEKPADRLLETSHSGGAQEDDVVTDHIARKLGFGLSGVPSSRYYRYDASTYALERNRAGQPVESDYEGRFAVYQGVRDVTRDVHSRQIVEKKEQLATDFKTVTSELPSYERTGVEDLETLALPKADAAAESYAAMVGDKIEQFLSTEQTRRVGSKVLRLLGSKRGQVAADSVKPVSVVLGEFRSALKFGAGAGIGFSKEELDSFMQTRGYDAGARKRESIAQQLVEKFEKYFSSQEFVQDLEARASVDPGISKFLAERGFKPAEQGSREQVGNLESRSEISKIDTEIAELRAAGTPDHIIKRCLLKRYHPDRQDGGNPEAAKYVSNIFRHTQSPVN